MGTLYWIEGENEKESSACGELLYRDLQSQEKNVVLLSQEEIRRTYRAPYDMGETDGDFRNSSLRDAMLNRFLVENGIDVVYCALKSFDETKDWIKEYFRKVEFISSEHQFSQMKNSIQNVPFSHAGAMCWITGLSGAGKTTIGTMLYKKMCDAWENMILVDGDIFRDFMNTRKDYSRESRRELIGRNIRLFKLLVDKGLILVCCTISMFDSIREWSRDNIRNYFEVYLEVSLDILEKRDTKGLYKAVRKGEIKDVVGVDQVAEFPKSPNMHFVNDGSKPPEEIVENIREEFSKVLKHDC